MKKSLTVLIIFINALFTDSFAQLLTGPYEVSGRIKGLKDGDKIIVRLMDNGEKNIEDSAFVKDGQFVIKGIVPEGPRLYFMYFGEAHGNKWARFLIEKGDKLILESDSHIDSILHGNLDNNLRMHGSRANYTFRRFIPAAIPFIQFAKRVDGDHLLKEMRDSVGFDPAFVDGVMAARHMLIIIF